MFRPSALSPPSFLAAKRYAFVLPSLAFLAACGPDPIPDVHVAIRAAEVVRDSATTFDIGLTFANNGPGKAMARDACPSFTVHDVEGRRVGPLFLCLAVVPPTLILEPGDVHTIEAHWDAEGPAGGRVPSGTYSIRPIVVVATPDRVWVPIDTPTVHVEVDP